MIKQSHIAFALLMFLAGAGSMRDADVKDGWKPRD